MSLESEEFPNLLPIAMKIAAKTIGQDLVTVQPISGPSDEILERIDRELKKENRNNKIDSIFNDKEYIEKKREDHPDYKKSFPTGQLFYMDFKYDLE